MDTRSLQKEVQQLWTVQDLIKKFRVTAMTIRQWRLDKQLPALVLEGKGRPAIRFVPDEVLSWAKERKVRMWN
jgi:hypothetical protein